MKYLIIAILALFLSSCGQKIEGTYTYDNPMMKLSWTFNPDSTAQVSLGSSKMPQMFAFEVSGKEITVKGTQKGNVKMSILEDGSLLFEGNKYVKSTTGGTASIAAEKKPETPVIEPPKTSGDYSGEYSKDNSSVEVGQQGKVLKFSINSSVGQNTCNLEGSAEMTDATSAAYTSEDKSDTCVAILNFAGGALKVTTKGCDANCGLNAAGSMDGSYQKTAKK